MDSSVTCYKEPAELTVIVLVIVILVDWTVSRSKTVKSVVGDL